MLQVRFLWHGDEICLTGIYAPAFTRGSARQRFYKQLHVPEDVRTQVILGDFNHVLDVQSDCNNPTAANVGRGAWGGFETAYDMQMFTDAKNMDNQGAMRHTFEGPGAWGAPDNHKRALDRIMISQHVHMIENSWQVHEPWGQLDHALVTFQMMAPSLRAPTPQDDDEVTNMRPDIIKSDVFQAACDRHIASFDWTIDARHAMDDFHAACRESYDACAAAVKLGQYRTLKLARKAVRVDSRDLAHAATATAQRSGGHAKDHIADLQRRARDAVERAANDLRDTKESHEREFTHLSTRKFMEHVNVRKAASTFQFQEPYVAADDVQALDPHMRAHGEGGFRVGSNTEGWSSPPITPPTPVSTARIHDQHAMLDNTLLFYKWLFRPRRWHVPSRKRVLAAAARAPCFTPAVAADLGRDINADEVTAALKHLQLGKAAGPDGITSEFYVEMGARIAPILAHVGNCVRKKGEMSPAQRQGHIVLLWKGKQRGNLRFYRPISLVQRIGTVLEMCIALRLADALPTIINSDQTGFLAKDGRRMHENIVKVLDMLAYSRDKDMDACFISMDLEKCFDRVSQGLLLDLYDVACGGTPGSVSGVRQPLTEWIQAFLAKQERRVVVNGELTGSFTLQSGVPQGSVMSVLSWALFGESLSHFLQENLTGLRTPSLTARMVAVRYADDLVLTLQTKEVALANDICEIWLAATEGRRNATKTEGIWVGRNWQRTTPWHRTATHQSPGDAAFADDADADSARVTWLPPGSSIRVLGVLIGYSVDVRQLWAGVGKNMLTQIRLWQLAKLSYLARVLVLKVMVWSRAFFLAAYYTPPPDVLALLKRATRSFIQHGALPRGVSVLTPLRDLPVTCIFTGDALSLPKEAGGLTMWDPAEHMLAQAAKWVVLLLEPQREEQPGDTIVRWTTIGRHYITAYTTVHGDTERSAYYLVDGVLKRPTARCTILPPFWRYALRAWHDARAEAEVAAPTTAAEVASMPLWRNVLLRNGATMPPTGWMRCGVRRVRDLWDTQTRQYRTTDQLRERARGLGATKRESLRLTDAALAACVRRLPDAWTLLLSRDAPIQHGELMAERGEAIGDDGDEYEVGAVWEAVIAPEREGVWWQRWDGPDINQQHPPRPRRVRRGAGPAGLPAPKHPATPACVTIYTDGGCVHNARVNVGIQLAGAGCAVLTRDTNAVAVGLYGPVETDPTHRHYLGAIRGTNNTGELTGVADALLYLRDFEGTTDDAYIYVDSKYAPAVVEARWSFASNVQLIQCIQRVLVQVRAARNVYFKWVAGHSGDRWNDAADDLATKGQHVDQTIRDSCVLGRYAPGVHTTIDGDPRVQPETPDQSAARGLTPTAAMPPVYRVSSDPDGDVIGFTGQAFADMISRVTWCSSPRGPAWMQALAPARAGFSIRTVRSALAARARPCEGIVHKHALEVAHSCPYHLELRWPSMWREGWSAPWPDHVRDMWWLMASGGQYVAQLRRHHDPATAFCRMCAAHTDTLHLDTHQHLLYECPCHDALWTWVRRCLWCVGAWTHHPAAFMLYGVQALSDLEGEDYVPLGGRLRVIQCVRGAVVEAFRTARAATMVPDANAAHPSVSLHHARKLLRHYVLVDWREATRTRAAQYGRLTHVARPQGTRRSARTSSLGSFRATWGRFAIVTSTGDFTWCGGLGTTTRWTTSGS